MEENKGLLLKSAMSYGLAMGIYWVIKYLFLIFGYSIPALIYIYEILSLAVPFIAYYLTKRYRQDIGGNISFFHAWRFGIMLYFFAALIVSIEHFIFFQFIAPPDFISNTINMAMNTLKNADVNSEVIDAISRTNFTPTHMAIQQIFNNIFYGIILSVPVAALVCRKQTADTVSEEK
ncbi:MAG: DUF4199 domain-containing protein [Parabacteroides sp.]|uniref:DUF4199 domain-containing protein n=1 Tax=uncultured Parabacteroides sp. TaxID=512312 RepID=UPI0025ED350F|nr:DUF4199 domain-containing protein [uncultured Parabacteroides sp.]MCD7848371.1 DUF4199 domain-containing protein [Parabacteroides sp.]